MAQDVLVVGELLEGALAPTAKELLGVAKRIAEGGAVAVTLADERVHDPFDGLGDWRRRRIVPVGDPAQRVREHAAAEGRVDRRPDGAEPARREPCDDRVDVVAEERGDGLGRLIHPTRLALTGKSVGPGLFELAALLGKESCLQRIESAIEFIQKNVPRSAVEGD